MLQPYRNDHAPQFFFLLLYFKHTNIKMLIVRPRWNWKKNFVSFFLCVIIACTWMGYIRIENLIEIGKFAFQNRSPESQRTEWWLCETLPLLISVNLFFLLPQILKKNWNTFVNKMRKHTKIDGIYFQMLM